MAYVHSYIDIVTPNADPVRHECEMDISENQDIRDAYLGDGISDDMVAEDAIQSLFEDGMTKDDILQSNLALTMALFHVEFPDLSEDESTMTMHLIIKEDGEEEWDVTVGLYDGHEEPEAYSEDN